MQLSREMYTKRMSKRQKIKTCAHTYIIFFLNITKSVKYYEESLKILI